MQQKKIGNILYVFDVTPYEITQDTDATTIKVQEEVVAGFKELNESLADKIVAYNYHVMCVNVPEWAPYVDDVSPELAWSANSATVTIGADDNVFPTLANPHSVTVTYSSSDTTKATINASTGAITLAGAGNTTISATFAGNDTYYEQTVSYTLTVQVKLTVTYTGETPETTWPGVDAKGGWIAGTIISGIDKWTPQQGDVYEFTLNPGDEFEFDERNMYSDKSITFSPELSQGTGEGLYGIGQAYVIANTNVTATVFTGTAPDNNEQPE